MKCLILFVMLRYYISATDILIAQCDTAVNFFYEHPRSACQPVSLRQCDSAITRAASPSEKPRAGGTRHGGGQGSVLVRQQEGGDAAVALGDDPQAVVAVPLGGLALVDRIGRQDAFALHQGLIVQRLVLGTDIAPVAS